MMLHEKATFKCREGRGEVLVHQKADPGSSVELQYIVVERIANEVLANFGQETICG